MIRASAATTWGRQRGGRPHRHGDAAASCPDINVVYTINEPAAAGAFEALKVGGQGETARADRLDRRRLPGRENVKEGVIGATAQQYPLQMAVLGIEAIKAFADTGEKPAPTEGKSFVDTGVTLITDGPVDGVESITAPRAWNSAGADPGA
jgi:fructose transport system substrate-binding protein